MNDFVLLQQLQEDLISTLEKRKNAQGDWITRDISRTRINRLRLQIQEVMLRIERSCTSCVTIGKEDWYV